MKKARKMLSFSLIKFTGNNTVPAQQQISELAAAPFFWGDHLGKYHFTTKKKKLPLNATHNQHLQPDNQPAWRNKIPLLSCRSGPPTTVKASARH